MFGLSGEHTDKATDKVGRTLWRWKLMLGKQAQMFTHELAKLRLVSGRRKGSWVCPSAWEQAVPINSGPSRYDEILFIAVSDGWRQRNCLFTQRVQLPSKRIRCITVKVGFWEAYWLPKLLVACYQQVLGGYFNLRAGGTCNWIMFT